MSTENTFDEFLSRAEEDYLVNADDASDNEVDIETAASDAVSAEAESFEPGTDGEIANANDKMLAAGKLYDIILRHPDWRVVEVSSMGNDYCHPLKYHYSHGHLLFQYDGSARQYHHEAECEDIIDLNGGEPFEEKRYGKNVYILQDIFSKEWDWDGDIKQVRKATLDAGAKWIKLHPEE